MPEGLTQTKTPTSKNPAGFKSECRPVSSRNRGRLQIGTVAGFRSEYPAGINRNPHLNILSFKYFSQEIILVYDCRPALFYRFFARKPDKTRRQRLTNFQFLK
jgi:hypothetical protein